MEIIKKTNSKLVIHVVETEVPKDLHKALAAKPTILTLWKDLTPIARRDFITWIEGAKQEETRARRIGITCDKLATGKRRPCCYAVVPMNFYKALGGTPQAKAMWSTLNPSERRDYVSWIDKAKDKGERKLRTEKACLMLASGKRHP